MTEFMESQFRVDVHQGMIDFDPYMEFGGIEDFISEDELYQEAFGATKKNVFQKIGAIIKKAWKAIIKGLGRMVAGIRKFFSRKKGPKMTATQIALSATGLTVASMVGGYKVATKAGEQKLGTLNDPVLDNAAASAVSGVDLSTPLLLTFEEGDKITFNILTEGMKNVFTKGKNLHTAGYKKMAECIGVVFNCVHHPESVDGLIKMMTELRDTHNISMDIKEAKSIVNKFWVSAPTLKFTCTLEEWETMYQRCSQLGDLLISSWDDPNVAITQNGQGMDQEWIGIFNNIAQISSFINYGLTLISDTFRHMYDLHPTFHNTCKDIDTLDSYIATSVNVAVPGKYLYKSCKEFCDVSMCHTLKDENGQENFNQKDTDYSHVGGYGRFVMFPADKNTVIKCAYNIYGLRSNKIEESLYADTQDVPEVHEMLCGIRQMSKNSYVMVLDRCVPTPVPLKWATGVRDHLNQVLVQAGKNFRLHDINQNGFGKIGDKWVIVDYGQMRRIPTTEQ